MYSLAVNQEFQLLAGNILAETEVLDGKLVIAIGGEAVANQHSAASSKWQTLDMLILRGIARCDIGRFRGRFPKANGHAGDPGRRRHICFQQRRRYGQRTRNIIETSGRVIRRQERSGVDLEIEEV